MSSLCKGFIWATIAILHCRQFYDNPLYSPCAESGISGVEFILQQMSKLGHNSWGVCVRLNKEWLYTPNGRTGMWFAQSCYFRASVAITCRFVASLKKSFKYACVSLKSKHP